MNFQSMLFEKLWGVSGDVISLNRFHGILQRTEVDKVAKHFHHCYPLARSFFNHHGTESLR